MLAIIGVLVAMNAVLELWINSALPWVKEMQIKYEWFNITWSIGISFLIGMMFPAAGLMVAAGAIGSSVLLIPYYKGIRKKRALQTKRAEKKGLPPPVFYKPRSAKSKGPSVMSSLSVAIHSFNNTRKTNQSEEDMS